jgi:hypothetical protein
LRHWLLIQHRSRNDGTPSLGTADLLVNGVMYAALGTAPTTGNWSTFTASYLGLPADAGSAITIELRTSGAQGDFDNVVLSDSLTSAVPEPSTLWLFGGALLIGLGRMRRRISQ